MPLRFPIYDSFGSAWRGRSRSGSRRTCFGMARHHLRRVAACAHKLEEAQHDRDQAIFEAWQSGETQRDIARYAGISHQRVQQIIAKARNHS